MFTNKYHNLSLLLKCFNPTQVKHVIFNTSLNWKRLIIFYEYFAYVMPRLKSLNAALTVIYGSAEGPLRGVENRNLLSHPDDLRMEAYVIRMT